MKKIFLNIIIFININADIYIYEKNEKEEYIIDLDKIEKCPNYEIQGSRHKYEKDEQVIKKLYTCKNENKINFFIEIKEIKKIEK